MMRQKTGCCYSFYTQELRRRRRGRRLFGRPRLVLLLGSIGRHDKKTDNEASVSTESLRQETETFSFRWLDARRCNRKKKKKKEGSQPF